MMEWFTEFISFSWLDSYDLDGNFYLNYKLCWFLIWLVLLWAFTILESIERKRNGHADESGHT